jgi:hypothetical protein
MTKRDDKMIEEISAATSTQRMNSLNSRRDLRKQSSKILISLLPRFPRLGDCSP